MAHGGAGSGVKPAMRDAIDGTTLEALRAFPRQIEAHYASIPAGYAHWKPPSWDGIPSERFTAIEQVWHVLDIELEGYQPRFLRTLREDLPLLASIDSEAVAVQRDYAARDVRDAFRALRDARAETVAILMGLDAPQLSRAAVFEGYGPTTVRGLAHYLCSHDQQHLAGLQWLLGQIDSAILRPR